MRTIMLAALVLACSIPVVAQRQQPPNKQKSLTLSGCVQRGDTNPDQYTITSDDKKATTYRLTGIDVREFEGKRVEVVGIPPKIVVKGGLYPSPNVAAQAGAMDPSRAATAAMAGGPAATTAGPLPEFRIQSIKPVAGTCPER